jgi:hypothetical protein
VLHKTSTISGRDYSSSNRTEGLEVMFVTEIINKPTLNAINAKILFLNSSVFENNGPEPF